MRLGIPKEYPEYPNSYVTGSANTDANLLYISIWGSSLSRKSPRMFVLFTWCCDRTFRNWATAEDVKLPLW